MHRLSVDGVEIRNEMGEAAVVSADNAMAGMPLRFKVWSGAASRRCPRPAGSTPSDPSDGSEGVASVPGWATAP